MNSPLIPLLPVLIMPRPRALFIVVMVVVVMLWAWHQGPLLRTDSEQLRLDTALPLLNEGVTLRQPFRVEHNGLREVSVQVARYGGAAQGSLLLWLEDDAGRRLAEQRFDAATLSANQVLTLPIPRQGSSAGQRYVLGVRGEGVPPTSLWGYSLSVLDEPLQLEGATSAAQSLRLTTRYELTPWAALRRVGTLLTRDALPVALALLFLLAPGALLLTMLPPGALPRDVGTAIPIALASGWAVWALLWHGVTLLGLHWNGVGLWSTTLMMGGAALWRGRHRATFRLGRGDGWLALIVLGTYATRLLATSDLAFLPWVDSVRHATISTVMAATGQTMHGYAPLLPDITAFPYHWGFHVLPASLRLMDGPPIESLLLSLQSLLNALVPLAAYSMVRLMSGRQRPALLAAFFIGFPLFFPGYYATWGRLTQLTGLLLLGPLAGLTWQMMRGPSAAGRLAPWVGILAAGLFLVHVRVFIFFLPLPPLLWIIGKGRRSRPLLIAMFLAALLALPRALELAAVRHVGGGTGEGGDAYLAIPWHYALLGWERAWFIAAALSVGVALVMVRRSPRRAATPLLVAVWWALLFVAAALPQALPRTGIINVNSVVIALCLPIATLMGWGGHWLWQSLYRWPLPRSALFGAAMGLLLAFGVRQQVTIINPQTILALPADAEALAWGKAMLPRDAVVAVNAWPWLNGVWSGSDGGAWLVPLTGFTSTTPPPEYTYNATLAAQVVAFNKAATEVGDWSTPEAAAWLRSQGVTHLYAGPRGGFLDPAQLSRNPEIELLYSKDGAFWFAIRERR